MRETELNFATEFVIESHQLETASDMLSTPNSAAHRTKDTPYFVKGNSPFLANFTNS